MSKDKEVTALATKATRKPHPTDVSGCVVCGQYGELTETAGDARWHKDCGDGRPDVIAKVKKRVQ